MCTTLALCLCGCLSASEAVAGFSNSNVILIGAFLVIGQAIFATGLAHDIATFAMRFAKSERKQVFAVSLVTALLSGFLSNTGVAAMMIPIVMGICHESGTHRSKLMNADLHRRRRGRDDHADRHGGQCDRQYHDGGVRV
ncbi:MAG TPA: anion permease [Candidatus Oscillibacter avistercoris]|nr:anion permease [Candidatus Oscillibacter avistercoris]